MVRKLLNAVRAFGTRMWARVLAGVVACAVIAVAGQVIWAGAGFSSRLPGTAIGMQSRAVMWTWDCPRYETFDQLNGKLCTLGAPWSTASIRGVLWGDSHAEHLAPELDAAARGHNASFILYTGCPAALGGSVNRQWPEEPGYPNVCRRMRDRMTSYLGQHPDVGLVLFASAWTTLTSTQLYAVPTRTEPKARLIADGLGELISRIATVGREIYALTDLPGPGVDPVPCELANSTFLLRRGCPPQQISASRLSGIYKPIIDAFATLPSVVTVVHPGDGMCDAHTCLDRLDGEFLFEDSSHLRRNLRAATNLDLARRIGLEKILDGAGRQAGRS